jgi:3-methylcrotonyl-CoA carboxylase alpha subunit/geranyl-CoA carboxylase alpha subunit
VALDGRRWHVQAGGVELWLQDASFEPARRAGEARPRPLRAPFNGRVLRRGGAGPGPGGRPDPLVIESMKLEHVIAASAAAQVAELLVAPGQQAPGQALLRLAAPAAAPVSEAVA